MKLRDATTEKTAIFNIFTDDRSACVFPARSFLLQLSAAQMWCMLNYRQYKKGDALTTSMMCLLLILYQLVCLLSIGYEVIVEGEPRWVESFESSTIWK
jgi:hypothetical protein